MLRFGLNRDVPQGRNRHIFQIKGQKFLDIVAFYSSPSEKGCGSFENLDSVLCEIQQKHGDQHDLWLCGDFNLPDVNWENHQVMAGATRARQSEFMLEICHKFNMDQIQLEPTRITRTTANVLDLFFTSNSSLIDEVSVIPGFSDHEAVFVCSSLKPEIHKKPSRKIFLYSKADLDGLRSDLGDYVTEYMKCCDERSVEDNWTDFKTHLFSCMEKHIPSKMSTTRYNTPWFNRNLHRMRRKQQRLYNRAKHSGNNRLWEKYRDFRRQYNKALRQAQRTHMEDIFSADKEDNKKAFFKYIKNLRRDRCGVSPLKTGDNIVSDPQGKANILSDYFKSVFTRETTDNFPEIAGDKLPTIPPLVFTEDGTVLKLLHNLNPNKASGPDKIPIRILRECADEIAPFLQSLFTQSLNTGDLPTDWKTAFITPLFKKGDRSSPSNHRPVSLTSVCCKLMEHCIFKHIMNHCEKHDVITDVHLDFVKSDLVNLSCWKRSTT